VRLPFGLGRRSSSGDGASSDGSGTGSGAAPARAAAPSRAWASLPPIQRTAGAMPLVAAPGTFASTLPGSQGLPPIVQPLGHEVSSLGTPGLVVARARPVETTGSGSIPAPVQRRAARGGSRTAPVAAPVSIAEPDPVESATYDAPVAVASAAAPIRSMPTVSRQAIRMPDRPLTNAANAARPAAVQRAAAAAAAAGPTEALPRPSSGGMRRVPSAAPAAPAALPTLSRDATSTATTTASSQPATVLPIRRGLGEPLLSVPASARPVSSGAPVVSRSTTSGPMPIAASGMRPAVQRSAASPTTSASLQHAAPATGPSDHRPAAAWAQLPELPHLPVARSASAATPTVARTAPAATAPSAPEIRPIAGMNPIRPAIALQRDASDDADGDADDEGLPSPWWAPASEAQARPVVAGQSSSEGLATSIQRSRADSTDISRPAGAGGGISIQRSAGVSGRSPAPAHALPLNIGHRAASSSNTPVEAAPPPSISFPSRSIVGVPVVQTSVAGSPATSTSHLPGSIGTGVTVQRDGTVAVASPTPVPAAGQPGAAGPAGAGTSSGSGTSGHSERDLDELAQALFGRIRGRIRSDLIYDREAKGLTFDNV
jgi:hypothetical protein